MVFGSVPFFDLEVCGGAYEVKCKGYEASCLRVAVWLIRNGKIDPWKVPNWYGRNFIKCNWPPGSRRHFFCFFAGNSGAITLTTLIVVQELMGFCLNVFYDLVLRRHIKRNNFERMAPLN